MVCLTNLKPAKMRGVESTAMLLAVSKNSCLSCLSRYHTGNSCFFEDMEPCDPDALLKSKGPMKVWDRVQVRLGVNENGEATYLTRIVIPSLEKY